MSVDSVHAQYDAYSDQWRTMRDFSAGEEAVKAAGPRYLPMLGGQGDDANGRERYAAYKKRASFFNGTGRTIDGLSGMIFRKPPIVERPDAMKEFMADVTLGDLDFMGFAETLVEEVLTPGRAAILVDFPRVEAGGLTQAEADRMNLRPFFSLYTAESILNWRVGQIGNRTVLTQVRLKEEVSEPVDEFESEVIEQIRVLDLDEEQKYRQRVFRKSKEKDGKWAQHGDDIYPEMRGQKLDYIPLIFSGPRDTTPHVCKPPLIDLAELNASHYRTSADLEHGAHFVALPTPYCFGVQDRDEPTDIGPEAIWTGDQKDVTVGMLEFTGSGLEALETRLDRKENQMAALGARMLAPEKRQAEAAETAEIHRQGEMSVLASLSMSVSTALTKALEIARDWMGLTGDIKVKLNTDFKPSGMNAQMFTAWVQAAMSGKVSSREFFDAMQQGEQISAEKTFDEHQAELEEEPPAFVGGD